MDETLSNDDEIVSRRQLDFLVCHLFHNVYRCNPSSVESNFFLEKCIDLFQKDHPCTLLDNTHGYLCAHYPSKIIIPTSCQGTSARGIMNLVSSSRAARCRSRFVVPVMLYGGKYICRSATLSGGPEIYLRRFIDVFSNNNNNNNSSNRNSSNDIISILNIASDTGNTNTSNDNNNNGEKRDEQVQSKTNNEEEEEEEDFKICDDSESNSWVAFSKVRSQDIRLLKRLNIRHIVDLMVEKKKVKYFVNVTSSEKVDKENRYGEFLISSLPYPGCEFFKQWRDNKYQTDDVFFDWSQDFVDANLKLPCPPPCDVVWGLYKTWNLTELTKNYLKLMLHYLTHDEGGLLIHCISGWDRTPIFVSLLRMSLWADGLMHQSLSPLQMLYFTIAYDWFLFGHNFPNRYEKGEEVFYFCFHFLPFIVHSQFSLTPDDDDSRSNNKSDSSSSNTNVYDINNSNNDNNNNSNDNVRDDVGKFVATFSSEPNNNNNNDVNNNKSKSLPSPTERLRQREERLMNLHHLFESIYQQHCYPPIPSSFIQLGFSNLMNNLGFAFNKSASVEV